MKKKLFVILISLITMVLVVGFNHNDKQDVIINNGVKYAIKLNGEKTNNFPPQGKYNVIVNCNHANAKWDYDAWKLHVYNISEGATCDISFTKMDNYPLFNDKIISLQGNGQVFNEKGYRYEGKEVDNYVLFNNELWRIIGVLNTTIPNVGNQNLVKIIRSESIGSLLWDKNDSSDWGNNNKATLRHLLNRVYLDYENHQGEIANYCYGGYYSTAPGAQANCNYEEIGIKQKYREMIENVTWYLGTIAANDGTKTADEFYEAERSNTKSKNNKSSWNGKIGLMYASDYGFSARENPRTCIDKFDYYHVASKSWLYGQGEEWLITHCMGNMYYLKDNEVYSVDDDGVLIGTQVSNGIAVRPTLYLKSNVYTKGGDGTLENPYVIGI